MRNHFLALTFAVAATLAGSHSLSHAANVTSRWFGGYGFWTERTNWLHTPTIPGADFPNNSALTYDVEISSGDVVVPAPVSLTVQKLRMGGTSLYHDYTITANDLITWMNGSLTGSGTLIASNG